MATGLHFRMISMPRKWLRYTSTKRHHHQDHYAAAPPAVMPARIPAKITASDAAASRATARKCLSHRRGARLLYVRHTPFATVSKQCKLRLRSFYCKDSSFFQQNFVPLDGGISLGQRRQRMVRTLKSLYFISINLASVKTVAVRHRFAAYHN